MPESDLALITEAAQEAARIATRYWRSGQKVEHKEGGSPVSEGDYAVDRFLREHLLAARPDYGWLSEETEDSPHRLSQDTVFIVDPIDGTRSYVAGEKTWAISIAVVHHGAAVAGVVLLPVREKVYAAAKGQGATLNGTSIRTGTRTDPDGAQVLAPKPTLDPKWWQMPPPQVQRHWRPSLAYRFCLVAEGRFDAVLTLRDAFEWDIAAGVLIAEEAGAQASDRNGKALEFNSPSGKSDGVFVAGTGLHQAFLDRYLGLD